MTINATEAPAAAVPVARSAARETAGVIQRQVVEVHPVRESRESVEGRGAEDAERAGLPGNEDHHQAAKYQSQCKEGKDDVVVLP